MLTHRIFFVPRLDTFYAFNKNYGATPGYCSLIKCISRELKMFLLFKLKNTSVLLKCFRQFPDNRLIYIWQGISRLPFKTRLHGFMILSSASTCLMYAALIIDTIHVFLFVVLISDRGLIAKVAVTKRGYIVYTRCITFYN